MSDEIRAAVDATRRDRDLVERLRAGDESAFMRLVEDLEPSMRRVARMYVSSDGIAEEVVQDAWIGVLKGLDGFEGRSSLRTWIFRILVNIAKTRGRSEGRSVPFSTLAGDDLDRPAWDPSSFLGPEERWAGHWSTLPFDWRGIPEARVADAETLCVIREAIEALPPLQAEVIRLRDIAGWSTEDICNALELTTTNQRVLLHRARAKVRDALEAHFRTVVQA